MTGILYVVATPIGNLEDVTLRALRILRDVSLIAAEDTRRTARLLQHYSITTKTTSLHEHNEREKAAGLIERLKAGDSIALVSDAGTPIVSDPGRVLVAEARAAGIRVEAIPGPSAVMAAVSASGLPADGFCFLGFPPTRSNARKKWFEALAAEPRLVVIFEAPHRVAATIAELEAVFGPDHTVGVARELTKTHEELVVRPISELRRLFAEPRGEFTLMIPPRTHPGRPPLERPGARDLTEEFVQLTKIGGLKRREALKRLSEKYAIPVNVLYAQIRSIDNDG